MQERRRLVRWQINSPATVQLEGQGNPFDCNIEDINPRGVKMRSSQEWKKDNNLALNLALSPELSLNIETAVVWNKAQGTDNLCGLYFTRIKDTDRERIFGFVQENFPRQIGAQFWKGLV
jgi:hypothetical protein